MTIDEAERKQGKLDAMIDILNKYSAKKIEYIEAKNKVLISVKNFTRGEKKLLKGLKMEYFGLIVIKKKKKEPDMKKKKKQYQK